MAQPSEGKSSPTPKSSAKPSASDVEEEAAERESHEGETTRLGKFIQTYSSFLSSFVIGMAGLIATSIWQYKQSEIARRQAESQQKMAEIKAANDWRIERAEILAKNLQVLASSGANNIEQRFGVLLSLTRGDILDPELAVSYALELGKENADYMRAVLASASSKDYQRLANAYLLTCMQRLGVARPSDVCRGDKYAERSGAIAELFKDELDAAAATSNKVTPLVLLRDERQVQANAPRLSWLFEPWLADRYGHRQLEDIERFESSSVGARLVSALVLATERTGELVTNGEAARIDKFHADRRKWLAGYLLGPSCDPECRAKLVDTMLTNYALAEGDYDDAIRRLLQRPRAESGPAIGRLHDRLLWCQVDGDDLAAFRDQVLTPALAESAAQKGGGPAMDDLLGLTALVPDPKDPKALAAQHDALALAQKQNGARYQKWYASRRALAERERRDPPPAMAHVSFCSAAPATPAPAPAAATQQ